MTAAGRLQESWWFVSSGAVQTRSFGSRVPCKMAGEQLCCPTGRGVQGARAGRRSTSQAGARWIRSAGIGSHCPGPGWRSFPCPDRRRAGRPLQTGAISAARLSKRRQIGLLDPDEGVAHLPAGGRYGGISFHDERVSLEGREGHARRRQWRCGVRFWILGFWKRRPLSLADVRPRDLQCHPPGVGRKAAQESLWAGPWFGARVIPLAVAGRAGLRG